MVTRADPVDEGRRRSIEKKPIAVPESTFERLPDEIIQQYEISFLLACPLKFSEKIPRLPLD
jgi:hypothetical protein